MNRTLAAKVFGSTANALGAFFKLRDGSRVQVVGVAEDGKYESLTEDPTPALFVPVLQMPMSETCLVVRASGEPQQLAAALQSSLRGVDRALPLFIEAWRGR